MSDGNGGSITPGQRLSRIEERLEKIEGHLEERITRHKEKNEKQVQELSKYIRDTFGARVKALEDYNVAEKAVHSYRKWLIGGVVALGTLMVGMAGLLIQLLGKVS